MPPGSAPHVPRSTKGPIGVRHIGKPFRLEKISRPYLNDLSLGAVGATVSPANSQGGGVVFDRATNGGSNTFSHTCSGTNRYLVVGVVIAGTTNTVSTMTYAGSSMTLIKRSVGPTLAVELWGIVAPATGANNVVITLSAGGGSAPGAVSFTNVDQVNPLGANGATSGTSSTMASAAITGLRSGMLVDVIGAGSAVLTTAQHAWNDDGGDAQSFRQADGTAQTTNWTSPSAPNWALAVTALNPADPPDDAMDIFGTGATYDTTHVHPSATKSALVAMANGATASQNVRFNQIGVPPNSLCVSRFYFWIDAAPTQNIQLFRYEDSTGVAIGGVRLTSAGTLVGWRAANGVLGSASAAIPTGQWIRVECAVRAQEAVANSGYLEIRAWWTDPESTGTPDYTNVQNPVASGLGGNAIVARALYGSGNSITALTAAWNVWIAQPATNYTDWVGPVASLTSNQTVNAPAATASASAPAPGLAAQLPPPAATASASAPTPGLAATVPPPAATASASAPAPAIQVQLAAPVATASASAPIPTVAVDVKVSPPAATASASAPTPTLQATIPPPAATANASAPTPTLQARLSPPAASASASAPVPTLGAAILPLAATANASAPAPALQARLSPPAATASASAPTPTLDAKLSPPAATASASAPTPGLDAKIGPPVASANASAPAPTVSSGAGNQTVSPPAATANASAPTPTISVSLAAPAATASASAPLPALQARIAPPAATASASSPTAALQLNLAPPVASASASAPLPGTVGNRIRLQLSPPAASANATAPTPTVTAVGVTDPGVPSPLVGSGVAAGGYGVGVNTNGTGRGYAAGGNTSGGGSAVGAGTGAGGVAR